jgi:glycerol kinase
VPVLASRSHDATALGVAALARLAVGGAGAGAGLASGAAADHVVEPEISADQAEERLAAYSSALESVLAPTVR